MEEVYLECVKENSKLRIKILSTGYYNNLNCQFPKNLRVEGQRYSVPSSSITLVKSRNKHFYRISSKSINIVNNDTVLKVFEDDENKECIICMTNLKSHVFITCGHYVSCKECAETVNTTTKKCPICRCKISSIQNREDLLI